MTISGFICVLDPDKWCFPYQEALRCYLDLFDEVVVVDGGSTDGSLEKIKAISNSIKIVTLEWPWEYKQREYARHYNFGFDNCHGDWVFKLDADWLFHESDFAGAKNQLLMHDNDKSMMAVTMPKLTMLNKNQYHRKGKMINGVHMKFYRDQIKSGVNMYNPNKSDWTDLIIYKEQKDGVYYGELIPQTRVLGIDLTIYNYDCFFRTKEKCKIWYDRSAKAYFNETGYPLYGEPENNWVMWAGMMKMRYEQVSPQQLKVNQHPVYIINKINNITPDQWGYDNWKWDLS